MATSARAVQGYKRGGKRSKHDDLIDGLSSLISLMKPHEKLTPERQLAEEWGVSRMTLRRALEVLQLQGRIYTIPSSGLFVAEPKVVKTFDATSLSEVMRHRGIHPKSKVHLADKIPAPERVAKELEIKVGDPVYRIEQTFFDDELPMVTETSFVIVDLAQGLLEHDLTQSLSRILQENFEKPILRVKYRVRAVVPKPGTLERLSLPLGSATLEFCARGVTTQDRIIFYVESFKRGDKYDLSYEVELD
jgi:GntR family transcriptional regulator